MRMMPGDKIHKAIRDLPASYQAEVLDFVEYLKAKADRAASIEECRVLKPISRFLSLNITSCHLRSFQSVVQEVRQLAAARCQYKVMLRVGSDEMRPGAGKDQDKGRRTGIEPG